MIEKKYRVELSKFGTDQKTIGFQNYQWTIYQDQIIKESSLTKNFPQYFVEVIEVVPVEEIKVSVVKEVEVKEVEVKEDVAVEDAPLVVEDVKIEEVVVDETPVLEVTKTDEEILNTAKALKTKTELEAYGKELGIELNKQKSLKYMINDLEAFLKSK